MLNNKSGASASENKAPGSGRRMSDVHFAMSPTPPYDHGLTASHITFNQAQYGADVFEDGHYRRLLQIEGRQMLVDVDWNGEPDTPALTVQAHGPGIGDEDAPAIERTARWLLGTDQDLAEFYQLAFADDRLAPLVNRFRGLHIPQAASVFEALVSAILGQQVSSVVARVLRNTLVETYGEQLEHRGAIYRTFPTPAAIAGASVNDLRAVKLSGRKAEYVRDVAEGVAAGELDLEGLHALRDEEVVEELCRIRGVGPWTAHWLLIRAFGRADGFPHGDLALQRHVTSLLRTRHDGGAGSKMSADEALEASLRWAPYRSYATTYLFAAGRQGLALHQ